MPTPTEVNHAKFIKDKVMEFIFDAIQYAQSVNPAEDVLPKKLTFHIDTRDTFNMPYDFELTLKSTLKPAEANVYTGPIPSTVD